MPIDLYDSVKSCSNWVFGSDALNNILGSSLFVAILISLVIMLIVMICYPAKAGTSFGTVAKMGIYIFFATLTIVFLHDSVLKYMFEDNTTITSHDDFMRGVTKGGASVVYSGDYMDTFNTAKPTNQQVVHTDSSPDDESTSNYGDDDKPAYSGESVVTTSTNYVLGGGRVPKRSGNPYK